MFDYNEAELRLRSGVVKIKRQAPNWDGCWLTLVNHYCHIVSHEFEGSKVKLFDGNRWAFLDLNHEDLQATDWIETEWIV